MSRQQAVKSLVAREYLRVSQDKDGTAKSLNQQESENHAAFAERGWQPHPTPYRDPGRSASRYARREREDFAKLISDLEADAFDADILAIWESSRGSRRLGEWAHLIDLCEDKSVQIFVTTHRRLYDPSVPRDRRSMGEDAVDAEYESAKTSERIQRHVAAAAKAGKVHGKNLYGYQRYYTQGSNGPVLDRIEAHPEQAPVVQEAARRVETGESYYAIAKSLNERGIPARRPNTAADRKGHGWTGGAVKQMLSVPAYAGKRAHRGEIVGDAVWPALIEYERWVALQALLFRHERRRNPNTWTVRYLCTGVAFCAVCGAKLAVGKQNYGALPKLPDPTAVTKKEYKAAVADRDRLKQRRKDECLCAEVPDEHDVQGADRCPFHYRTYVCTGLPDPATGKRGFHVAMKVDHLDYVVSELIIARLERPDFLALVNESTEDTDDERRLLLDQIERDRQYLETVRAQAAELLDLSMLLDQQQRVQPRIDEAQRRLEQLAAVDPVVLSLAGEASVRTAWDQMDVVDRRKVIAALARPRVRPADRRGRKGRDPERVIPGWK
jgi:DNA invertase Pin-like site-specific DNA recombinase